MKYIFLLESFNENSNFELDSHLEYERMGIKEIKDLINGSMKGISKNYNVFLNGLTYPEVFKKDPDLWSYIVIGEMKSDTYYLFAEVILFDNYRRDIGYNGIRNTKDTIVGMLDMLIDVDSLAEILYSSKKIAQEIEFIKVK